MRGDEVEPLTACGDFPYLEFPILRSPEIFVSKLIGGAPKAGSDRVLFKYADDQFLYCGLAVHTAKVGTISPFKNC